MRHDVPDDAGTVVRRGDCLGIASVDFDVRDSASVLLKRSLHNLGLVADFPDSDLSLHTSRDNSLTVGGWGQRCDSVVVRVVDGIQKTARLGQESSDLSIAPSRKDALAVSHELDAEALEARDFDAEQLLTSGGIPHSDVVH